MQDSRCWIVATTLILFSNLLPQEIIWLKRFDTGRYDSRAQGAIDPWGNVILAGQTADDWAGTNADIAIVKYNSDGETLWARTYDSGYEDEPNDCAVGNDGGVVVVGNYHLHPSISSQLQLIKYDRDGNLRWFRRDTIGHLSYLIGVAVDESLNIYVSGATLTIDPINYNLLLRKYNANGDLLWSKTYDLGRDEDGGCIAFTPDGNLAGVGGTGSNEEWAFDFLSYKFTREGDTIWTRQLDVKNEDWGYGVGVDSAGNIYVTGDACQYLSGWIVPDSCVTIKYAPDGTMSWVRVEGIDDCTGGSAILQDSFGKLLVAGFSYDTLVDTSHAFLLCYTIDGTLEWHWLYRPLPYNCDFEDIVNSSPGMLYTFGTIYNNIADTSDFMVMKLHYSAGIEMPSRGVRDAAFRLMSPNPVRAGEPICLFVQRAGDYRVMVCDVSGRQLVQIYSGYLNAGVNSVAFVPLPAGVYLLIFETALYKAQARLVIVR